MESLQNLRIPIPGGFESPSLTGVGRIQRGLITAVLCCMPVLHAFQWQWKESSFKAGFRCKITEGDSEIGASDERTQRLFEEYAVKYPVISQRLFFLYLVLNLVVFCLYMSYVSERFSTWLTLNTTNQRGKTLAELKASRFVFVAYLVQLCCRWVFAVSFVLYNCLTHSVVLPSERKFEGARRSAIPFFPGDGSFVVTCSSDQAFESSMFNITLLTFVFFCGTLSLTELIYTWKETKGFEQISDYYICMFLLRQNGVTDTINTLIEKEVFLENQSNLILASEKGALSGMPPFCPRSTMPPSLTSRNIYIYHENLKYKGLKKQRHKQELFRTYSRARKIPAHSFDDLFKPGRGAAEPKRILIVGEAGIGKTELAFQLTRLFGTGLSPEGGQQRSVKFVFRFNFKELYFFDEALTFQEFLDYSICSSKVGDNVYRQIVEHPKDVLFIFDGLSEWGCKKSIKQGNVVAETGDKMSPTSLVLNLLSGELLSGCTVVVTTRPTPLISEIRQIIAFDRYAELGCFKTKDLEEYVEEFFRDKGESSTIVRDRFHGDENLKVLCSVPLNCFLLCSWIDILAPMITKEKIRDIQFPSTTTGIFERLLDLCMFPLNQQEEEYTPHPSQVRAPISFAQETIDNLSHLALEGIIQERLIFREADFVRVQLDTIEVDNLVEAGFLRNLRAKPTSTNQPREDAFCFRHPTVQEFLAARRIVRSMSPTEFREFLEAEANESHFMTLQFVAGLCKDSKAGRNTFVCLMQHLTEGIQLRNFAQEPVIDHQGIAFLCKCIFESGLDLGHAFAREATSDLKSKHVIFVGVGTGPQETQAMLYCLRHAMGDNVKKVTMESSTFGDFGLCQVASSVCDESCRLDQVNLTRSNVSDDGMLSFLEISTRHSYLAIRVLGLRGNAISSDGAKYLACVLFNDWCNLEELHLGSNKMGDLGLQYFSEALCSDNCKIHTLDLSSNGITHKGTFCLSEALSSRTCSLRTLYLQKNQILDVGMEDLCKALCTDESNLRVLFASSNEITDRGIKFVEKALAHKSCSLQELYLGYNKVTDNGVKSLLQALPTHQVNLKVLSLANNPITDAGVKMLANALRNSSCNLRRLCISLGRPQVVSTKASKLQVRYVNAF